MKRAQRWRRVPGGLAGLALVSGVTMAARASDDAGCAYRSPAFVRHSMERGQGGRGAHRRPTPNDAALPSEAGVVEPSGCLTPAHVFAYEDTDGLLLAPYQPAELYALMIDAANALLAEHGDAFDFIGFWTNFDPKLLFGTAFYLPVMNDVIGIGDAGAAIGEDPRFDLHGAYGLAGTRVQGMVHMWNVNAPYWQPGEGPEATQTRRLLGHEFAHRFGIFLPEIADGRRLQGDNASCGHAFHWSRHLDGQGSAIEMSEWIGADPAVRVPETPLFNADTGGVYSLLDLYLMGFVSASEVDAGMSELRFMEDDCASPYGGPIAAVEMADIISRVGPRIPGADTAQKHFRTGWIMIHAPGAPPTDAERAKAMAIAAQHTVDFRRSTIGRGTMSHALFADCDCDGVPDAGDCDGCPADLDGNGIVGLGDVLAVAAAWGPCGACPEDLDRSGAVDVLDLVVLLGFWGVCD